MRPAVTSDGTSSIGISRVLERAVLDQHGVAGVAHDGGVGKHAGEHPGILARIAGLLAQLAHRGVDGRRVGPVHDAAGNLQLDGVRAVAELLHHHQLAVRRHREHVHPVHAVDDEKVVRPAGTRRNFFIRANGEDAVVAERLGARLGPRSNHRHPASGLGGKASRRPEEHDGERPRLLRLESRRQAVRWPAVSPPEGGTPNH
jgi:hypothetical protein